jgi:hypothetical protein
LTESTPAHDVGPVAQAPRAEEKSAPGGGGIGMAIPGLAVARGGAAVRRASDTKTDDSTSLGDRVHDFFNPGEASEKKHDKLQQLLLQRAGMTNGASWQGTDEQWEKLDEIDKQILALDPSYLPGPDNPVPSRIKPEKGLLAGAEDWLSAKTPDKVKKVLGIAKGKAEKKVKDEIMPDSDKLDEQLVWGLKKAGERFETASTMVKDNDELRDKFAETAAKFKEGAEAGEKIEKAKEWAELLIEFKKAVAEAEDADPTTEAGTTQLFEVMHIGGKIGDKALPAPLNTYFKLLSNEDFTKLSNVKRVFTPDRPDGPHGEQWKQKDK